MNALQRIKQGKKNHKHVDFPGTDEKVAIAILTSSEITEGRIEAAEYIKKHNIEDDDLITLEYQKRTVYRALRDKDNINKRLADSYEEFETSLDNTEIQYFYLEYSLLTNESSPFLNAVDEATFEQLKKTLEKTKLNDLSGPSLVALRNFLLTLV